MSFASTAGDVDQDADLTSEFSVPAATPTVPRVAGNHSNLLPLSAGASALDNTINRMQDIVNAALDCLFAGEIETLPPHVESLIDRLVSLKKESGVSFSYVCPRVG